MKAILVSMLMAWGVSAHGADTRYFVYLFALDDGLQTPTANHTWASFVAVTGDDVRATTINWLPRSKIVRPLAAGPERGKSFPAADAFAWAARAGLTIAQWGPYEIREELYVAARKQAQLLASGEVWYRVMDQPNRIFKLLDPPSVATPRAVMCIHAISDIVYGNDERGFLLTGLNSGIPATEMVAWHLKPWYVAETVDEPTRDAMDEALGLGGHEITRRKLVSRQNRYCKTLQECRDAGM